MMEEPNIAGRSPQAEQLESGKSYKWCACGKSAHRTFCDGSHKGSSFTPKEFTIDKDMRALICVCKHTSTPPYCDGAHNYI